MKSFRHGEPINIKAPKTGLLRKGIRFPALPLRMLPLAALCCFLVPIQAGEPPRAAKPATQLEYRDAARYTHIIGIGTPDKRKVQLMPLVNLSGIPDRNSSDSPKAQMDRQYYEHGRLPAELDAWLENNLEISGFFQPDRAADYQLSFRLEQLTLPQPWAPDDKWWQKLHDQVDRWGIQPRNAALSMSVTLSPLSDTAKSWLTRSKTFRVQVALSNCDLNAQPQALLPRFNNHHNMREYAHSLSGQTFIAATNFLLLTVADFLSQEPQWGEVIDKQDNMILLQSPHYRFQPDSKLSLYYQRPKPPNADASITQLQYRNIRDFGASLPAGEVHVDQVMGFRALAWPVNLRPDHIKVGDRVRLPANPEQPVWQQVRWHYQPNKHCAAVDTSIAINQSQRETTGEMRVKATE